MEDVLALFPDTYGASRERFRQNLMAIQKQWPQAELSHHRLPGDEDLTIDWIRSDALQKNEKVLVFTTAEHGIEGYVGSAMLQRFIEKYLPRLDRRTTGLLLVHAINPWGMKHHRRVNAENIDLNRTFLWDQAFDPAFNPDYDFLNDGIHPTRPIQNLAWSNLGFYKNLVAESDFQRLASPQAYVADRAIPVSKKPVLRRRRLSGRDPHVDGPLSPGTPGV